MKLSRILFSLFALVLLVSSNSADAQQVDFYRAELRSDGVPQKYDGVNGSPYLFENWAIGTVTTVDKSVKRDVQLKYDEIDDILLMKNDEGKVVTFTQPVAEFSITDPTSGKIRVFKSQFAPSKANTQNSFFEVIYDGKVKLIKKNHKVISENKQYSGATSKTIVDAVKYYIVNLNASPLSVKPDAKSIAEVLNNKQEELTSYAKSEKLNLKKEPDLVKLLTYYDSL